jgi:hypothetical protein
MSGSGPAPVAEELIDSLDRGRFELYRDGKLVCRARNSPHKWV